MNRLIFESNDGRFRITEHVDQNADFEDLCGDTYNPDCHPEIPREQILKELADFTDLVNREGVYGYVLERWNPEPGKGWEHVDSCWGFVGQYSESEDVFNHDIVDELKSQIETKETENE